MRHKHAKLKTTTIILAVVFSLIVILGIYPYTRWQEYVTRQSLYLWHDQHNPNGVQVTHRFDSRDWIDNMLWDIYGHERVVYTDIHLRPDSPEHLIEMLDRIRSARIEGEYGLQVRINDEAQLTALIEHQTQPDYWVIKATDLSAQDVRRIADIRGVDFIQLLRCELDISAVQSLAQIPDLKALTLGELFLKTDHLEIIADIPTLEHLTLNFCHIGDDALPIIARRSSLASLIMIQNKIRGQSIGSLNKLTRLETLIIAFNPIDVPWADQLDLPNLKLLDARHTAFEAAHMRSLVSRSPNLVHLVLGGQNIDDALIVELAKLPALETLELWETANTERSVDALIAVPSLNKLGLVHTLISDGGIERLQTKRPDIDLQYTR